MNAKETNFLKFLNSPKQFLIPIYQRTYSWGSKECKQLWEDIVKAGKDDTITGHFVGSIVYVENGLYQVSALPKLLVIDGQQRLTTLSLIVAALCHCIKENSNNIGLNSEKIANYYLFNKEENSDDKYKLILTKTDKTTYLKVLNNMDLGDESSSRIKGNYEYFIEQIKKSDLNVIYKGISKLIIIDVSLDRDKDNPQLIFESLNSTGLELTQVDLIRNYILMGLEKDKQESIYSNYWYPMEKNFGHSDNSELFNSFMRDYLTIILCRIPNKKDIYSEFKQISKRYKGKIEELVKNIYEYSNHFVNIALEKEPDDDIRKSFADINELKVDVSYPFILSIYKDYIDRKIDKTTLLEILRLVESYVFRRAICGVPTASLNKTFSTLYKQIDQSNYIDSTKARLILQDSYKRFPGDEEFKNELLIKDIFNFRSMKYLLKKVENYGRKEVVDVESYTIEHIMPQNSNLSDEWKKELGDKWKEIQKIYLHTIGNLTLTGYNSEYSDASFKTKRDMKDRNNMAIGFKDSPIRLNKSLGLLELWNEEEIKKRAEEIVKAATIVWAYPKIDKLALDKYITEEVGVEKPPYTIDDYPYLKMGEPMRILFDELRKRILNINSSVMEKPQKLYIAYKSITNFVDIVPQKNGLILSLNIAFDKINDEQQKCKDVSGLGKWGNGDTQIKVSSINELDYCLYLIKQAYDDVYGDNSVE